MMATDPIQPDQSAPLQVVETEMALLGGLMVNNRLFDSVADVLRADDFFDPFFGRVYSLIERELAQGRPANPVTLKPYLEHDPSSAEFGPGFLSRLTGSSTALTVTVDFARQIADFAKRRRLYAGLQGFLDAARDDLAKPVEALADGIDTALTAALQREEIGKSYTVGQAWDATMAEIEAEAAGDKPPGLAVDGLDDWNQLTGNVRRGEVIILAGRPSMGKAQPLDAKILGLNGWLTMGDVKLGDELASVDGAPSVVTGVFPQGEKQIYRIRFSDGRSTECCAEHLWEVMYRDWESPRVVATEKLIEMLSRKRYAGRLWVETFHGDFGGEALTIDPWLLGFLLGDGSICGGQVRFSTRDPELLARVTRSLPAGLTVSHQGRCDYRITGGRTGGAVNPLTEQLRDLGIFETRSHDKFIPPAYLNTARADRLELLRGLMDSDGWAETFAAVRFSTASPKLAEDVCYLVRSLGGLCSIRPRSTTYTYKGETKAGRTSYTCRIRFTDAAEIFTLDRKIARCTRAHSSARLTITSIEATRIAPAQCIAVSHPRRLYVTDEFVVTHNTAMALTTAIASARAGWGTLFISLEMSVPELMKRAITDIIFDYGRSASFDNVKAGKLSVFDRERVAEARAAITSWPMVLRQDAGLKVGRLAMMIRRYKRQMAAKGQTLDIVFIDYLGLVKTDATKAKRYEEVSEVSRTIKQIARELDVAIVLLAQLNREVERREDKRPVLSDLRDSGEIEQDADVVLFVYREQYYLERAEPDRHDKKRADWETNMDAARDRVELIAAKVRNGRVGKRVCHFFAEHQAVRGSNFFSSRGQH